MNGWQNSCVISQVVTWKSKKGSIGVKTVLLLILMCLSHVTNFGSKVKVVTDNLETSRTIKTVACKKMRNIT